MVTSTQYPVMSGSTRAISSVKGGVQVREMVLVEASLYIPNDPTAERRPTCKKKDQKHVDISWSLKVLNSMMGGGKFFTP